MASRCPNGHDIPDGNTYCGTCGLPAVAPPETGNRCSNGHVVADGNTYCEACGQPAETPPIADLLSGGVGAARSNVTPGGATASQEHARPGLATPSTPTEPVEVIKNHTNRNLAIGFGALVTIVIAIVIVSGGSGSSAPGKPQAVTSPSKSAAQYEGAAAAFLNNLHEVTQYYADETHDQDALKQGWLVCSYFDKNQGYEMIHALRTMDSQSGNLDHTTLGSTAVTTLCPKYFMEAGRYLQMTDPGS